MTQEDNRQDLDRWLGQLEKACADAQQTLAYRAAQLAQHRVKRWFLSKMHGPLQNNIHQVAALFTQIAKTVQRARTTDQLTALQPLEAQMQQMKQQKLILQKSLSYFLDIGFVYHVISLLTYLVIIAWSILPKFNILGVSSDWMMGSLFAIGGGILLKAAYQCYPRRAQVDEQTALVEQIDTVIQIFEKTEGAKCAHPIRWRCGKQRKKMPPLY